MDAANRFWCIVCRGATAVLIRASLEHVEDCCGPCIAIQRLHPDPGRLTLFSQPCATLVSMLDEPVPIGDALYVAALSRLDAPAKHAPGDWRLVMACLDTGGKAAMFALGSSEMFCGRIVHLPRTQDAPTMLVVEVRESDPAAHGAERWYAYFSVERDARAPARGDALVLKRVATRPATGRADPREDQLRSMLAHRSWELLA